MEAGVCEGISKQTNLSTPLDGNRALPVQLLNVSDL